MFRQLVDIQKILNTSGCLSRDDRAKRNGAVISRTACLNTPTPLLLVIVRLKRDGTRAETRFRLSPKRTSPFKSAGASVQSTAGSRGVRISVSNAGYTTFRGSVKSTGYPLHSPVSPLLPLPCVTVCHQVSNTLHLHSAIARWRTRGHKKRVQH